MILICVDCYYRVYLFHIRLRVRLIKTFFVTTIRYFFLKSMIRFKEFKKAELI